MAWTLATWALLVAPASANNPGVTHYPDLQTIIPTDTFSVVQGTAGREFRYTHLIYNQGPGPLDIMPQYNQASGSYQGQQRLWTHNAAGTWSQVSSVRVPDPFIFHAPHGHFHFPLAAFGLYAVAPGGGPGAPVALSPKNGFCISDSYSGYNSTVPHSGAFAGSWGECADPTKRRGLSVGSVDEYDYRDPGQAIPFDGIPDGTYWFRAITDPYNDLVEGDESNNETDVSVTIANGVVTPGQVTHPDTTPPAITLTGPSDNSTVKGSAVKLSATTAASGGVQFLVDGAPVGSATESAAPFTLDWDSRTVVDGVHWLSARTTDAQGRSSTAPVAAVTVDNSGTPPPPPPPPGDGPLSVDATVSVDGSGAQTAPALTTTKSGDLLLAFVSLDGRSSGQTSTVSGGGLTWTLVRRANTRPGASEIWKAQATGTLTGAAIRSAPVQTGYHQSLTVVAFAGAAGVGASTGGGAASGAPQLSLTTTAAGGWVWGVGNDWDRAVARTPGSGQTLAHQWVDTAAGDTFWVQSRVAPTANAGTTVTIDDTSPANDQWNLAAVEVLPGTAPPPPPPPPPPPADTSPPQVRISDPGAGATVSGIVPIGAVASDNVGVTSVQFKLDGATLGAPLTSPPFQMSWDTRMAAPGQHTLTAEAVDAAGNRGASSSVIVNVDNSAPPPATIGVDQKVFKQARGALVSPALTTPTANDVIVAFVAQDGASGAAGQRSTVTGGGLTWTLVKRSDTQSGVAEIWSAKATGTLTNAVITATPLRTGYDGLLTVVAFKNAAGTGIAGATGASTGAPDVYLPGVSAGSWVWAVGNDWDGATARTPISGQVIQQQWVDSGVGDTFWVQSTLTPSSAQGLVTIHDTAPTNHRYNFAAVEITAAPAASIAGASSLARATAVAKTAGAVRVSSPAHLRYCRLTGVGRRFA